MATAGTQDLTADLPRGLRMVGTVTEFSYRRRWLVLSSAFLLALCGGALASRLEIRSSFAELLPRTLPSVAALDELVRRVGGDGTVLVSVETFSGEAFSGETIAGGQEGLAKAEALAPILAAEIRELGPDIRSVEYTTGPTERWYAEHWPLFVPLADLRRARAALTAEVHTRKLAANPLAFGTGDRRPLDHAALGTDVAGWIDPNQPSPRERVSQRFAGHLGGFYVHPDGQSITIIVRPAGTSLGVTESRALLGRLQAIVDRRQVELARDGLRVGFGGTFPLTVAEYEAVIHDLLSTAALVIALVLAALILFFREIRSVVALLAAMAVGLAVTFGLTELTLGYLNTETAFLGAIVLGNGINYGLIYLAGVRRRRRQGQNLRDALREGAILSARATLLAAAASSVSFGVLAIAANRGFRHFGFIGGVGMLLCWLATFTLLPALLGVLDSVQIFPSPEAKPREPEGVQTNGLAFVVFRRPALLATVILVLAGAGVAFFVARLPSAMETNLDNLSNQLRDRSNRELVRDNQRAQTALGKSIAGTVAILPSPAFAERYCQVIRERMRDATIAALIEDCDTLSSVVPLNQPEKLAILAEIASSLSDGLLDTLPAAETERLRSIRADLRAQRQVTIADAPAAMIDRFRERDGQVGNLAVVTARPQAHLEDSIRLIAFARAVRGVVLDGRSYDATGESVILADLLDDIDREGPRTTALSFACVFFLVLVFFRRWRSRVEVSVTLVTGVALMAGAATLLGLRINFFDVIVFPITFGIAVDYGANIASCINDRGGRALEALREMGPAVFLCSLTSIIGYVSLLFSVNRALRSFGWYAVTGEVASIFAALVLLPALTLTWERRRAAVSSLASGKKRSAA